MPFISVSCGVLLIWKSLQELLADRHTSHLPFIQSRAPSHATPQLAPPHTPPLIHLFALFATQNYTPIPGHSLYLSRFTQGPGGAEILHRLHHHRRGGRSPTHRRRTRLDWVDCGRRRCRRRRNERAKNEELWGSEGFSGETTRREVCLEEDELLRLPQKGFP